MGNRQTLNAAGVCIRFVKDQSHGDHVGEDEMMLLEEALTLGADLVREKSDAEEFLLFGVSDGVFQEAAAEALAAMVWVHDDVFHEDDEAALGRADGEKQVDHSNDEVVGAHDENATAVGLLEDEADAVLLFAAVGCEVFFITHEGHDQLGELGQILHGGGLDTWFRVWRGFRVRHVAPTIAQRRI